MTTTMTATTTVTDSVSGHATYTAGRYRWVVTTYPAGVATAGWLGILTGRYVPRCEEPEGRVGPVCHGGLRALTAAVIEARETDAARGHQCVRVVSVYDPGGPEHTWWPVHAVQD